MALFTLTRSGKGNIPDILPYGGKLSDHGGARAAIEYRVWVRTIEGKNFFRAERHFDEIYTVWRKLGTDLEFYTDVSLPIAVVWDKGANSYLQVDPDAMIPYIMAESPEYQKQQRVKRAEEAVAAEKKAVSKKTKAAIAKEIDPFADKVTDEGKLTSAARKLQKEAGEEQAAEIKAVEQAPERKAAKKEEKKVAKEEAEVEDIMNKKDLNFNPRTLGFGKNIWIMIIPLKRTAREWLRQWANKNRKKVRLKVDVGETYNIVVSLNELNNIQADALKAGYKFRMKADPASGDLTVQKA